MTPEERREIQEAARKFAESLFNFDGHPDSITAEWLQQMHPELSAEEAEEYRVFCRSKTISLKGCYGQGQYMWPKWKAWKAEVASL